MGGGGRNVRLKAEFSVPHVHIRQVALWTAAQKLFKEWKYVYLEACRPPLGYGTACGNLYHRHHRTTSSPELLTYTTLIVQYQGLKLSSMYPLWKMGSSVILPSDSERKIILLLPLTFYGCGAYQIPVMFYRNGIYRVSVILYFKVVFLWYPARTRSIRFCRVLYEQDVQFPLYMYILEVSSDEPVFL